MKRIFSNMAFLVCLLFERCAGALVGHKCDLCREWTLNRKEDKWARVTWCSVCMFSELKRHGF